jgi:hypothetical protein
MQCPEIALGCQSAFRRPVFGLRGGIGAGQRNDPADIGALQRTLGWHEQFATANAQDTNRPHQIPAAQAQAETAEATPALFGLIRRVQQAHGLKQDATLLPGGETQRTLNQLLEPILRQSAEKEPPTPNPHPTRPKPDAPAPTPNPHPPNPDDGAEPEEPTTEPACEERRKTIVAILARQAKCERKVRLLDQSYAALTEEQKSEYLGLCREHGGLADSPPPPSVSVPNPPNLAELLSRHPALRTMYLIADTVGDLIGAADKADKDAKTIAGYPHEDVTDAAAKAADWFKQLAEEAKANVKVRKQEAREAHPVPCYVDDLQPPVLPL